ncbi:MAG: phytanoyl-CoA dioxygenase family protein [Gammaproteobacteria bacterium]
MNTVGWGIIGCGNVVDRKAGDAFKNIAGSRLVAVMRRTEDKARDFAQRRGAAVWTTDAQTVIDHPEVNAIYVATPPDSHLEYALAACAAGKACVVEKPAGRTDAECGRMVEAFEHAGVPLFVSYYRRFLPKYLKIREIIRSGELGTITSIDYRLSKRLREGDWRLSPAICGGGQFYDLSGHVLDLFDDWFGPLTYTGGSAANSVPVHAAEDSVAISFLTPQGAVGSAVWDFTASKPVDELVIQGHRGCLRLSCMDTASVVRLEQSPAALMRVSQTREQWQRADLRRKLGWSRVRKWRFSKPALPHQPMLEKIVGELIAGTAGNGNAGAALRTSRLANRVLDEYYGGRADAFWERPLSWRSLRAQAANRPARPEFARYEISPALQQEFEQQGYIGPFKYDASWQHIPVPAKRGRDLHLTEAEVFDVCTHPCIVRPVAQLLGTPRIALFKTRFVVKHAKTGRTFAWHQDVGMRNGGYLPNGDPVQTVTVWMAFDEVNAANGAMQIIPGSHRLLIGDYQKRIKAELLRSGALTEEEISRAVTLDLKPGEFYIFHSWLLHTSGPNASNGRRAGLNMRYAAQGEECDTQFEYFPLLCSAGPKTDLASNATG